MAPVAIHPRAPRRPAGARALRRLRAQRAPGSRPRNVDTVVTGVSATGSCSSARSSSARGLVLVHHGLFWDGAPTRISPTLAQRLRLLLEHDIKLAAYHLPLDAHPQVGNNALIAEGLGCDDPRAVRRCIAATPIGVAARFRRRRHRRRRAGRARRGAHRTRAAGVRRRPRRASGTIGIVSGGGAGYLAEAVDAGPRRLPHRRAAPSRRWRRRARPASTSSPPGHYATETFGVRALGERLAERFGVRHVFVDVPNPV